MSTIITRRARALVVLITLLASLAAASNRPALASRNIALLDARPGHIVGWRYNVNDNWSMISDRRYRGSSTHPW